MAKQIPELDIITTPTAGQESIIETVVARHDTYDTSRMTLAQIFTLGSISGAIKSALDTLSGLIAGNTSSINTLSSTKLNIAWGTRTGLTAKAVVATDASGNEVLITGTLWQQIGFDASNIPVAVTPTVDINGLTEKTTPVWGDCLILSDSEASFVNKKVKVANLTNILWGNGSDWALNISSGTTTIPFTWSYIEKNYSSLTITGGTLNFSGAPVNGGIVVIKVSWDCTITGGTIDISGMGGQWWPSISTDWTAGTSAVLTVILTNKGISWAGSRAGGVWFGNFGWYYSWYCWAGGGALVSGTSSAGGNGGWLLIIECNGDLTFSTPATVNAAWLNGWSGSGGGGGGVVLIKANSVKSSTGTINVNWGNWWNGVWNNGWGGGGSYSSGGAGGASGGAAWTAWTSNTWWSGGTWGTNSGWGGGGAWFYKIN